jgi:hypothetical protein
VPLHRAELATSGLSQATTNAPRVGNSRDGAVQSARRTLEKFTCGPRPRIAASSTPAIGPPTTARPHVRRHARRHRTRGAAGPRPRNTPQGACFMTSLKVTTTFVASEVKLYLAVAPSSSSPPLSPGPIASSSLGRRRTRSGPAAGPPLGTIRSTNEHSVCTGSGHRSIAPSSSSPSAQRTRRGHAGEPITGPASTPLATALRRPSRREAELRPPPQRAVRRSIGART